MLAEKLKNTMIGQLHRLCDICEMTLNHSESFWCDACFNQFVITTRCQCCGLPMPFNVNRCGECLTRIPFWDHLYCLGDYQFPLSQEIHRVKYRRQFWRMSPMVDGLARQIPNPAALITSVPLHWRRYWKRGFNQSDLIAKQLAHQLQVPFSSQLFRRTQATPYQRGLNRQQRESNLHKAFHLQAQHSPLPEHVAICDDVVTTGSTVNQLCKLLLEVGVKRIDIYCLCRTSCERTG
jgi:ComF family protein